MNDWYMLTLVGEDRPGIVARVTAALYAGGWGLGEASMMRLGGNFTIMLMVRHAGDNGSPQAALRPVAEELGLSLHVDPVAAGLHRHVLPNVQVRVSGADRAGIVAQVTGILAEAGVNILDLESDVAGSEAAPLYIMNIEALAECAIEDLEARLNALVAQGIDVRIGLIETMVG